MHKVNHGEVRLLLIQRINALKKKYDKVDKLDVQNILVVWYNIN